MPASQPESAPDDLLRIINAGDSEQSRAALAELQRRADQSDGDPERWGDAADGYFAARMYSDAAAILRQLVDLDPENDRHRANLAMACWQTEQVALCRFHFKYLAERSRSAEVRDYAARQLEAYERGLGLTPRDEELSRLQESSLREVMRSPDHRTPEACVRLARLLIRRGKLRGDETFMHDATSVLEDGRQLFPKAPAILEHLVLRYLQQDPQQRLNGVLRELEEVAPESPALKTLADLDTAESEETFRRTMAARATALFEAATGQDVSMRTAALEDLRRMVGQSPENSQYRLTLAFALAMNHVRDEALGHAALLAQAPVDTHAFHFNLGQIFWLCGDAGNGHHHLDLARQFAETDEERRDVVERIADLEGQA